MKMILKGILMKILRELKLNYKSNNKIKKTN
jgi:hypothetical protein